MSISWPVDWANLTQGIGCEMCNSSRPDSDKYGVRIFSTNNVDAVLQRAGIQRGYTLIIWRGRHITEPYELTDAESSDYWRSVMHVAKALMNYYQPLKMNYETLGNSVPHLHTHLVPRYIKDPAPGRPFPLLPQDGSEAKVPDDELWEQARALRKALGDTA
ncbi:HIT family protein [Nocardia sp. NPDC050175]|uniref:HIT family protein n=1 Tax=Nocardia sp. NPDC050175 TaxID=3364317 RepID=UPI0037A78186